METYRQVMVEDEISVGVPISGKGKITICGVEYLVSVPTHTSTSVLEPAPYRVFDGLFSYRLFGNKFISDWLQPEVESTLQGLLVDATSVEQVA